MLQPNTRLSRNEFITDPNVPDPDNLPQPLGWTILIRPYPVKEQTKSSIILTSESIDYANYLTNVGRVVSIGPCCWNRVEHKDKEGQRFDWVKVGDFVEYPKNIGLKRKFKGVSYIMVTDDEVLTKLVDPQVLEGESFQLDIPQEHLKKYNTIYNETYVQKETK